MRSAVAVAATAALLVGCAGRAASSAIPARAASSDGAAAPQVPPERLRFFTDLHARKDEPPPGADVRALALELAGWLASPDEEVRDGLAYEVLAAWIRRDRRLGPDDLRALTADLFPRLERGIGASGDDSVFGRSFSALVLAAVAARENDAPFLTDAELDAMVGKAAGYAGQERDLRGHVDGKGWAHAAAHTSDWMKFLARHPRLTPAQADRILDGVLSLSIRRHGAILYHGEDGRMAQPVLELLRRDRVPAAAFAVWVGRLSAPFSEQGAEPFDAPLYAAQRNARNLLFTLFVSLSVEESPTPAQTQALAAVKSAIVR